MSISSNNAPCAICHLRLADKTNSHLIPSFFIAMVSSVDSSYKRGKELLYTIGKHNTTTHIGRSVKEEDLIDKFESITDERLIEMSKQTVAKDYIFCSHCEKKLGEYLESPWHDHLFNGKAIPPETAYFFWVSLLWRMSAFESISFKLPNHIEKALGKRLNSFIIAKYGNKDLSPLLHKTPFVYKVLYCKDYSKEHSGFIYYEFDKKSKTASLVLGDIAVCFSFQKHGRFTRHTFYGLENTFSAAPINDGSNSEAILNINACELEKFGGNIIDKFKTMRLISDRENIIEMWKRVVKTTKCQLPTEPDENFIRYVINKLYNNSVKNGEKTTPEHYAKCFAQGLKTIYGIQIV